MFRLINIELTENTPPEKEGYEHGYAIIKQLIKICFDGNKHDPAPPVDISSIDTTDNTVTKQDDIVNIKMHDTLGHNRMARTYLYL